MTKVMMTEALIDRWEMNDEDTALMALEELAMDWDDECTVRGLKGLFWGDTRLNKAI
jgi:hypothetical protein